jgi:aspartyl/asparaginyl-tRNA synthetase
MKSALELDQFDLESASKQQVAEVIQALLEQVKKDAVLLQSKQAEIESKDDKIQALTYELAYLRRIRYGVKSETISQLQADLFAETWDEDVAAVEAELEQLADQQPVVTAEIPKRPRAGRQPLPAHLPRIEFRHEPDSCQCGQCGRDLIKTCAELVEVSVKM